MPTPTKKTVDDVKKQLVGKPGIFEQQDIEDSLFILAGWGYIMTDSEFEERKEAIRRVRELTGASLMDVKEALDVTQGDIIDARDMLQAMGHGRRTKLSLYREAKHYFEMRQFVKSNPYLFSEQI